MSLARRHKQRIAARKAGQPFGEAVSEILDHPVVGGQDAPAIGPGTPSLAQRKRARVAAAQRTAANDNEPAGEARESTPYDRMLVQLASDQRRLKELKSVERKIELKRELLPSYADWVAGVLDVAREFNKAVPDEIVATTMVWRLDVGDYEGALELAAHMLRFGMGLPDRFERDLPTLVAEEIAEAACAALSNDRSFTPGVLVDTFNLVGACDMPDQVQAKLWKARGLELLRIADDPPVDGAAAGQRPAALAGALEAFRRAIDLHSAVGVKKQIERLERELKKDPATAASRPEADGA